MFGIGAGEMVIIFFVLLLAVGPDKMPTFIQSVGKGIREFRRTTRDLRNQVGLDDLVAGDPMGFKELKKDVVTPIRQVQREMNALAQAAPVGAPAVAASTAGADGGAKYMTAAQLEAEQPAPAVDVDFALSQPATPAPPNQEAPAAEGASEVTGA